MSKGVQIAIATLSIFGGIAWLVVAQSGGEGTFRYYASVGDFLEQPHVTSGKQGSRVHGFVHAGSIAQNLPDGYVDFAISDDSAGVLDVRYQGIDLPDLFREGAEVVVEGHYARGVFVADRVMAKCPSKYEAREEAPAEV